MSQTDNERWERRACKTCGHVRRVRVRDTTRWVPNGAMRAPIGRGPDAPLEPDGSFQVVGESYNEICRACDLERQIRVYERNIAKLREQVRAERERQAQADRKHTLTELKSKGAIHHSRKGVM